MVEAQPQFTPKQILEAGQRAVAEGRIEYARQFFQHLIDHYSETPAATSARAEIMGLAQAASTAAPPLASNAPDLRVSRPADPPRRPGPPPGPPSAAHRTARPDWPHDPPGHRAEPTLERHPPRDPLPSFATGRPPPERRPETAPPSRSLAPAPEKNYIAGRVFTGLLGLFGFLGMPLGIVMLYGVVADPELFAKIGITQFGDALWTSLAVFFASIGLILVAQMARAVFDAADAAADLARLERYRLGIDDEDD